MRVWRLSAALCGQRAAGAESSGCRPSSLWRVYTTLVMCCFVVYARLAHLRPNSPKVPPSRRLARHSRGEGKPSAASSGIGKVRNILRCRAHTPTPAVCRSLHSRRGLWPASNKPSANVAPSANSSKPAPTPPPRHRHRSNTLRCRLATQHPPRASAPVRPLSRTVSVFHLTCKRNNI